MDNDTINIDDARTPTDLAEQLTRVKDKADALLKLPEVVAAYEATGRPAQIAFLAASTMARRRFDGLFPRASLSDPYHARLLAEMRLIAAECILLSARCRLRRQPYELIKDVNVRCRKFARDNAERYRAAFQGIGV